MARLVRLPLAIAALTLVHAGDADAANTNKTRVAPAFWGEACIVTVDRAVQPVANLGLAIPFEDDDLTEDELPDSRRFQFFALCQDHPVQRELPNWVTAEDAQRAMDMGLIDDLPASEDVLATAGAWQVDGHDGQPGSCVVAINEAEARMPITCEQTANGIEWDTTDVPAGSYVVRSYTFEPDKNLWARRPGLVRVIDGDADPGPAVTLTTPRQKATAYEKPGMIVSGCVAGASGTTVTLQWAEAAAVADGDDTVWVTAVELTPDAETFEVLFVPPPEAVYKALYLRAIATDPEGRSWIAHADHEIVVLPDCGQAEGSDVSNIADGCGVVPADYVPPNAAVEQPTDCDFGPDDTGLDGTGGSDEGADDAGSTGGEPATGEGTGGSGGATDTSRGCRFGGAPPVAVLPMLLTLLCVRRRTLRS